MHLEISAYMNDINLKSIYIFALMKSKIQRGKVASIFMKSFRQKLKYFLSFQALRISLNDISKVLDSLKFMMRFEHKIGFILFIK